MLGWSEWEVFLLYSVQFSEHLMRASHVPGPGRY